MSVEPRDRPARPHEGAVVRRRKRRHQAPRSLLMLLRVGRSDDRQVGDRAAASIKHEPAGNFGDAGANEGPSADLAAQIAKLLRLLIGDADRLHRDFDSMGKIAMGRHARAGGEDAGLDIGNDAVGQALVLGRASTQAKIRRPDRLAPRPLLLKHPRPRSISSGHYAARSMTMPVRLQLIRMESAEMLRRQREARRKPALGGPNAGVIADQALVKSGL